jgi:PKD repeat protein
MEGNSLSEKQHKTVLVLVLAVITLVAVLALIAGSATSANVNLYIESQDIESEVREPTTGTTADVYVMVHNDGTDNATGFHVKLRDVTAAKDIGSIGPVNCTSKAGVKLTFKWDLTGASGGSHSLKATADVNGQISETDEEDNSASRSINVNLPPTAAARASSTSVRTFESISFNGNLSSDSDGTVRTYLWYFGDGSMGKGAQLSHSYSDGSPSPGMLYNVTLMVIDEDGGIGKQTITVHVLNRPPVAVAYGTTVNTLTPTSLGGGSSTDVDGKISRYRWTLHNGSVLWGSPAVVKYADDGSYPVSLTVWDDDGASDSTEITVKVLNQPPVVRFSANRTIVGIGDPIRFDASGSTDADGGIANITWIFGDRTTSTGSVVDHSYSQNGSYTVSVVVVDDDGDPSIDTVKIIVGNSPPGAVARADKGAVLTYEDIQFNGTSSFDIDDNIAAYAWDFGDGSSASGAIINHSYTDDGTYSVVLTVTDTAGAVGSSTLNVVVINRPPVASAQDIEVDTGDAALFTGSRSSDRDGYISEWRWDCGGGAVYSTANASHVWNEPGTYTVVLTVWDDDGASNSTQFNVTVNNRPPRAVLTASPLVTTLSIPVDFNGSGSWDQDGEIVNWSWNFGDGARSFGVAVKHLFNSYGTFLTTLTVRDNDGGINSSTVTITVRNLPPTADLNVTPSSAFTGEELVFNGSASTDPENQISSYFWSFGDGGSDTGPIVRHIYEDDGKYTVRLTVVDEDGVASYAEVSVTINNRPPEAWASALATEVKTLEDVTFSSEGSKDVDGRVMWYQWDFGDGDVAFGPSASHAFRDDGVYQVTLTVIDDDGDEATAIVEMTVLNRPPTAIPGEDVNTVTGSAVRLDGRASFDVDGQVVEWRWDFGDGVKATGPVVTHAFGDQLDYVVTLVVVDDDGETDSANLTVFVENVGPVAVVSGDLRVYTGEPVKLDGTNSYDLDGYISSYEWDFGDGVPKQLPKVEHTYQETGSHTVVLTVEDDGGLKSSISVTVLVRNRPPKALATADLTQVLTGDTISLDGTGSSDSDGSVVGYTWIFGDGAVAYGPRVSHVYKGDGIYMVVLTVEDDEAGADSTSLFIQVDNRPPIPAAVGPETTMTLDEVPFSAEGTVDPDGVISAFYWDFGDGSTGTGFNLSHVYDVAGNYTVRLTVLDDDSRTATTTIQIRVDNRPPNAQADVMETAYVNATVRYDGSASSDPDGLISKWVWDFGDGVTEEARVAYHTYNAPDVYNWTLKVYDDKGLTKSVSGTVAIEERTVIEPPNGDGGKDGDDTPGPGPVAALIALTAMALAIGLRRRKGAA